MRLLTRADWDGLVCAVLLGTVEKIEEIIFVHPKDMQDGKANVPPDAIIANLPYHPNCSLWFDHHISEQDKAKTYAGFKGKYGLAPSTARLVYEYYGGEKVFSKFQQLLTMTDKIGSARLTREEVTRPTGYVLLSYTIDPRTGLRGQHQPYFLMLIDMLQNKPLEEILQLPEVQARCERVSQEQVQFQEVLLRHSRQDKNVVITDFRGLKDTPAGNRFLIYALFPEANISVRLFDGYGRKFVVAALGHSIFNRTARTNVGMLLRSYGGGGGQRTGTVQLAPEEAEAKIAEIIGRLQQDG
jgi:hypothetical protein